MEPDDLTPPEQDIATVPTYRAIEARVAQIDEDERSIVHVINTGSVDRYRTVIDPAGGNFDDYMRNPVVLWCHDDTALPIGRAAWVKKQKAKNRIIAKTIFDTDEFAEKVWQKYRSGTMAAWSVRFSPDFKRCSGPSPDEIKANPALAECWMIYRKWSLMEYSAVNVPGNGECLTEGRAARSIDGLDDVLRHLLKVDGPRPEPTPPVTGEDPPANPDPAPKFDLPSIRGAITYHQYLAATIEAARSIDLRSVAADEARAAIDRARGQV